MVSPFSEAHRTPLAHGDHFPATRLMALPNACDVAQGSKVIWKRC